MPTLVIEDGTPLTTSNSFVSGTDFATYCDNRGFIIDAFDDDTIATALIRAGDYLNNEERFWWRGQRVNDEQGMAWPRSGVIVQLGTGNVLPTNLVPKKIKDAQCYLAFKQLTVSDVQPDLDRGGAIQSVSAGGVSVSYAQAAMNETLYQVAAGILKPYLRRIYYTITPTFIADDRGYDIVTAPTVSDGVADRPSAADTDIDPLTGNPLLGG